MPESYKNYPNRSFYTINHLKITSFPSDFWPFSGVSARAPAGKQRSARLDPENGRFRWDFARRIAFPGQIFTAFQPDGYFPDPKRGFRAPKVPETYENDTNRSFYTINHLKIMSFPVNSASICSYTRHDKISLRGYSRCKTH